MPCATVITSNMSNNNEVASTMFDNHPDLVKALVKTFSTSGVEYQFGSKSQPLSLSLTQFQCPSFFTPLFLTHFFL